MLTSVSTCLPAQVAGGAEQRVNAWRKDLAFLAENLPGQHANFFHSVSRTRFDSAVRALHQRIPSLTDDQITVELSRLVALVGDGHTRLWLTPEWIPRFRRLPIRLYQFRDGLFVQAIDPSFAELAGARVIRIGSLSAAEAFERVSPVVQRDNEMTLRNLVPTYLVVPEVLRALGLTGDSSVAAFVVATPRGDRTVRLSAVASHERPRLGMIDLPPESTEVALVRARDRSTNPTPLYLRRPLENFWYEYVAPQRLFYMQINQINDTPNETLADFVERALTVYDSVDAQKLVLDLRLNNGGNNQLNFPVINSFIRHRRLTDRGRFFVITSRYTFSAASHLATKLETHLRPIFVGEPMGGSPNHYADIGRIQLPNSKLIAFASSRYWQNSQPWDNRPWIAPHVGAELTSEDYRNNIDPSLNAIVTYAAQPPLWSVMLTVADTGSVDAAWRIHDAYVSRRENAYTDVAAQLNRLGYALLDKSAHNKAIAIFERIVRDYPSSNAYDSLGDGYRAGGDLVRARDAYRRAVELDPKNRDSAIKLQQLSAATTPP